MIHKSPYKVIDNCLHQMGRFQNQRVNFGAIFELKMLIDNLTNILDVTLDKII